jgi:diguanylate cyclase (GGDEF)-like protein
MKPVGPKDGFMFFSSGTKVPAAARLGCLFSFSPARLTETVRRIGLWPATLTSAALAVLLSVASYLTVQGITHQEVFGAGLLYATLIPALIAIPMEYRVFRLATSLVGIADNLQQTANRDFLTTCFNRRKFQGILESYWVEWKTRSLPFGILLFDLDNFKVVNDTHGHHEGDDVLVAFSAILERACSDPQGVFRLGGDEFAILQADSSESRLQAVAAEVCTLVDHDGVFAAHRHLGLGVSFGYGLVTPETADFIDVLKAADKAMYRQKNAGYCEG